MKLIKKERDSVVVRLTRDDLTILVNAISEAREALEDWEFSTRMGAEPTEAAELRKQLGELLQPDPRSTGPN